MRATCEALKSIRKQIAEANGIPYEPNVCTYDGPCSGTCPVCEAEARYIEMELAKRQKTHKAVNIIGVAKDKMPSVFSQAVAAATITAVFSFSAIPADAVAQDANTPNIEATTLVKVSGVVTSKYGVLAGANISIKGTERYTESDKDGRFTIEVALGEVLVVEYLDYERKEVSVANTDQPIEVTLKPSEAVAKSRERIRLGGAVSSLPSSQPLYVVDGVAIENSINPLSILNPKDIKTMEVLKDSAQIAPYSAYENHRYGVILITTNNGATKIKKNKLRKTKVKKN